MFDYVTAKRSSQSTSGGAKAPGTDPYVIVDRITAASAEIAEELAALSGHESGTQERVISLMPLADRVLLEASGVVESDAGGHIGLTPVGREVIDAAAIAAREHLTATERASWNARGERRMKETLERRDQRLRRSSSSTA